MPKWKQTLNFKKWWGDDSIAIPEKGKLAAKELKRVFTVAEIKNDMELPFIIFNFEDVCAFEIDTINITATQSFNGAMAHLYRWANDNRVWVKTIT